MIAYGSNTATAIMLSLLLLLPLLVIRCSLTMREGDKVLGVLHSKTQVERILIFLRIKDAQEGVHRLRNTKASGVAVERVEHSVRAVVKVWKFTQRLLGAPVSQPQSI
jgi:hypothetical protein